MSEKQFNETFLHTSPILTGVAIGLGMHGRGQRSRHSGCETTLHSRHFSEILPNLILFPHGTQDSGLITYDEIPTWSAGLRGWTHRIHAGSLTNNTELTVLETNSWSLTPPWRCGVLGWVFTSASGLQGCLKSSSDWTDSESNSTAAAGTGENKVSIYIPSHVFSTLNWAVQQVPVGSSSNK